MGDTVTLQKLPSRLSNCIKNWEKIGASHIIKQWITEGVTLPLLSDVPNFFNKNKQFTFSERIFIHQEIKELIASGAIRQVSKRPKCVSALNCVNKKGKKLRLILDLRNVNKHIVVDGFRNEGIDIVGDLVDYGDDLFTIDLKSGFHHIPVRKEDQDYLGFSFENRYYVFCVIPFGLSCSPYIFNKVLRPVIAFIREQNIKASLWVDDFLVAAKPVYSVDHRDFVIDTLEDLGFLINYEKSDLEIGKSKKYIGYIINSEGPGRVPWFYIEKDKIKKLFHDIRRCIRQGKAHVRLLAKVAGQAIAMSKAIRPGKLKLRSIYRLLAKKSSWSDTLTLDDEVISDLKWWLENTKSWNGAPLKVETPDHQIFCDSSSYGWGAGLNNYNLEAAGTWDLQTCKEHINFKELLTILLAIKSFESQIQNRSVQVLSDNSTAVAYVRNLGGPIMKLTKLAESIWATAYKAKITLSIKHLPGKINTWADHLSRLPLQYEWRLNPRLFARLDKMWGPHTIDRFASISTTQLPMYNSRYSDPGTAGIDALAQNNWGSENNYINAPFRLIPQVLDKIISQKAWATLIAPLWPAQAWTKKLFQLSTSPPVHIRNSINSMIRMGDGKTVEPRKNKKWKIFAWRIYGGKI